MHGTSAAASGTAREHAVERDELWRWLHQLERFAEMGLHARGLAHDLGNTLTSLMAGLELALIKGDESAFEEALKRSLSLSKDASKRLHAYLDFTRRPSEPDAPCRLVDAVEDALRILAHPLRKTEAHVVRDYDLDDDDVVTSACRPLLVQVSSNAVLMVLETCTRPAPTLLVDVRRDGDEAVLEVRASESGEAPAVDGSPTYLGGGTGLELEVSNRVVRSYGGRLSIDPERRRVCVALPATESTQGPPPTSEALATWRPWGTFEQR